MKNTIPYFVILSSLLFSCKEPEFGSITVNLEDGPADYQEINIQIEKVEVYVDDIKARGWYELKTNTGIYNLLSLQNTSLLLASRSHVPAGKVSQVKLILGSDNTLKTNDTYYPLLLHNRPGEKFSVIIPAGYAIKNNDMLNILIDLDAERSIVKTATNKFVLEPYAAAGTVSSPMELY